MRVLFNEVYHFLKANTRIMYVLFMISLSLIFVSINLPLCILISLIIVDYLYIFYSSRYNINLPFDSTYFGIVILSYYFDYKLAIIYLVSAFFIRLGLGKFSSAHFIKQPIMLFVIFLITVFNSLNFVSVAIAFYILRFIIEYLIKFILFNQIDFERFGNRFFSVITMYIVFVILQNIQRYF